MSICQFTEEKFLLRDRILHLIDFNPQDSGSRSDSPISDSHTISEPSPVSFMSDGYTTTSAATTTASDSGVVDGGPMTMHTSPKPERKRLSPDREERPRETLIRNYSPQAFKFFMEQHVENVVKYYDDRRKRRMQLEQEMVKFGLDDKQQELYRRVLAVKESNFIRLKRAKMNKSQFKKIKPIGSGAFGDVSLVRKVDGHMNHMNVNHEVKLFAMKTLKKSEVLMRNQVAHVKAERDILAEADNDWIVKLYHSFQVGSWSWFKIRL